MGSVGNTTTTDPNQHLVDPSQRGGPGSGAQQIGPDGRVVTENCSNGQCGTSSRSSANGSCSGGSCGSKAAYQRSGCSSGKCGSSSSSGSCGSGGCGGNKAEKSDCSNGQCGAKKGLFKATMMTVAASELAQLSIDYSQYLS